MTAMKLMDVPRVLCQPDANKSCGACCGMYNHTDFGYADTYARLRARTQAYQATARIDDVDSLRRFRATWEPVGEGVKLLSGLPSCPFLGFLEPEEETGTRMPRVGCMVHPLQNDGLDGRDCGVYERKICDEYLCAAHDLLTLDERRLVLQAVQDSYVYGAVITNMRLIKELLKQAANLAGEYPSARALNRPEAIAAAGEFFALMRDWPYAARDGVFGPIVAGHDLETGPRALASEALGVPVDPLDTILACLGTEVDSVEALEAARAVVRERVAAFAEALQ